MGRTVAVRPGHIADVVGVSVTAAFARHGGAWTRDRTGGNRNVHEAALRAWQLDARVVIPMHFGLWQRPELDGDPRDFVATYTRLRGTGQVVFPEPVVRVTV